ncbi:site-specific integrase [Vibrio parahaemolyticus]|uniref:site-specific integrase n=1 Tax=Vibrio parahaemolyticus TaxID=670 RepID=UPI00215B8F23|nr:site-specific integrase [Vibrio parahaemolyticus]MCR9694894.1 site-specific integrase [Vibrio parahaemolyticus]MCR9764086.1 site-specific integrase [Vibrio parahaemolyticus]
MSSNNVTPLNFRAADDTPFSSEQLTWINELELPKRVFLKGADRTDDNTLTLDEDWRCYFSGGERYIGFESSPIFSELGSIKVRLIKFVAVCYLREHSPTNLPTMCYSLAHYFRECEHFTKVTFLAHLEHLATRINESKSKTNKDFYHILYALRALDRDGFFNSTDDSKQDLEDQLLFVPRPQSDTFGIYQNLDNVIPLEVCAMIQDGITRWASKLTPSLKSKAEIEAHLSIIKAKVSLNSLRDCVILGLTYYTGGRPVQLAKLYANDIHLDTKNEAGNRYSLLLPFAKKSKKNPHPILIALPDELGRLIKLYIRLAKISPEEPLFPKSKSTTKAASDAIQRMLFRFSPQETKDAVNEELLELPRYTSTLFRHNVGHSMAMSGASATDIAYILGHSNDTVASRYIAVTPDIADIREQALGRNPVFKNMMALMLTGNLVHSENWDGRRVAGSIGGILHTHIGGCGYEEPICPFSQGRACHGCIYFHPFLDGLHKEVYDAFGREVDELIMLSVDTNLQKHPLGNDLIRRQRNVANVISRIENHQGARQ